MSIIAALLIAGCSSGSTGASESATRGEKRTITFGAVPAAFYLPIFVMKSQGFLEKRGYTMKLQMFNKNTDMMAAFLSHSVDVTAQGSGTLFPLEAKTPGQFLFLYGQYANSYSYLVPVNSKIQAVSDLAGKKIVTWPSPTANLCINLTTKTSNGEVPIIEPMSFSLINQVLIQGKADAAFNTDVFVAQGIREGKLRFLDRHPLNKVMNPFFNGGGIVSSQEAKSDPGAAKAVEQAFEESLDYIMQHPREARLSMATYVPASQQDLLNADLDQFVVLSKVDWNKAQELADLFVRAKFLDKSVDVSQLAFNP